MKQENIEDVNVYKKLSEEKSIQLKGGLYHFVQVKLCYNTNRIEGSKLTEEQTRFIYETNTIDTEHYKSANVDDIVEAANHFACFDYLLDNVQQPLSEQMIKEYHKILKSSTTDSRKDWFNVGEYKKLPNMVADIETIEPENVPKEMIKILDRYNEKGTIKIEDVIDFHYQFEKIHPFQDGNGRVGRLIMFKECLKNDIIPFIIEDEFKNFYYRGLKEYKKTPEYLKDTCLHAQDIFKDTLRYFNGYYDKIGKSVNINPPV